jgi:hypothetical protein
VTETLLSTVHMIPFPLSHRATKAIFFFTDSVREGERREKNGFYEQCLTVFASVGARAVGMHTKRI